MKTTIKYKVKTKITAKPEDKKISKLGTAMRKGILKGAVIELSEDVWNLKDL